MQRAGVRDAEKEGGRNGKRVVQGSLRKTKAVRVGGTEGEKEREREREQYLECMVMLLCVFACACKILVYL